MEYELNKRPLKGLDSHVCFLKRVDNFFLYFFVL